MSKKRSWTINQLKTAVKTASSYRQVISKLHLRAAGGNYEQIRKYILEYNLDTQHFLGKAWNKGKTYKGTPRVDLKNILVKNSTFQSYKLKKRLFYEGLKPQQCEECGWAKRAEGGRLPLELDHVNGDRHDNRLENLRILCPNCHSLQSTHRGRNRGKFARVVE